MWLFFSIIGTRRNADDDNQDDRLIFTTFTVSTYLSLFVRIMVKKYKKQTKIEVANVFGIQLSDACGR